MFRLYRWSLYLQIMFKGQNYCTFHLMSFFANSAVGARDAGYAVASPSKFFGGKIWLDLGKIKAKSVKN